MLNLPQKMGVEQGAQLSMKKVGKATKAESRSR
jgi:hypothetical protein